MIHPPAVRFKQASLRLRGKPILQDLSLELRCGELVALVGPGSSGKTQFLKLLATLHFASSGELVLFDTPVQPHHVASLSALRNRIGLQFQNFALFDSLSVAENIAFPIRQQRLLSHEEIQNRVQRALADVGLEGAGNKDPSELSGGMRRRVSIARVMALAPDIALFDDPVSGLDPVASARIMRLLETFSKTQGCLVVVASHDLPRLLPIATRVVALFGGQLGFNGTPQQAMSLPSGPLHDLLVAGLASHSHTRALP